MISARPIKELLIKKILYGTITKKDIETAKFKLMFSNYPLKKIQKTQKHMEGIKKLWKKKA